MIKKLLFLVLWGALSLQSLKAQENIKLMFYNLLNFPLEDAVPNRLQYLEVILSDYQPDVLMVCELNNDTGANTILSSLQFINPDYQSAVFQLNTSDDAIGNQNDLQQLLYYDSSKFILDNQSIVTTIFRDFNIYTLRLNTLNQASNPVIVHMVVCHLKASDGIDNENSRLQMVQDLISYLDTLPANSNVVLAGDFNVYTQAEPAFQELIDSANNNTIKFVDPADRIGNWHNNSNYIDVFTQSTRTQSGLGGSTGGFDDRFDFIMTSTNMLSNPELSYVPDSYQVYGNNANPQCYNQAINSTDCDGAAFSFFLRDALYQFSDHLPVTLELQTNQTLSTNNYQYANYISIKGASVVDNVLQLQVPKSLSAQCSLTILSQLGQVIKTIDVNSTLIAIETQALANGIYYITSSKVQMKPLKFIVAH